MSRVVCWFSCGAASAVATKLAIAAANGREIVVARCIVDEEHYDNERFAAECAEWFGHQITGVTNDKYGNSIYAVFEGTKYIAGVGGASCTRVLKREAREAFQRPDDLHVFGYTAEEQDRVDNFIDANNGAKIWPVLVEHGLTHTDCLAIVERAGIQLPMMYRMGYRNNNCVGCVKGGAGYWNKIRVDFPEQFDRMAKFTRSKGVRIINLTNNVKTYLDELPRDVGDYPNEPAPECGIFCELAERSIDEAA